MMKADKTAVDSVDHNKSIYDMAKFIRDLIIME